MLYITEGATETENVGRALAKMLEDAKIKRAFIAMRGEMGVGKTAFARGFASHFGISGIKSPTYTVVNEHHGRASIYHFDMYRIESEDDLYSIGFDDYIEKDGYAVVEWSENISDFLPYGYITVTISRMEEGQDKRKIEITSDGTYDNIGI